MYGIYDSQSQAQNTPALQHIMWHTSGAAPDTLAAARQPGILSPTPVC